MHRPARQPRRYGGKQMPSRLFSSPSLCIFLLSPWSLLVLACTIPYVAPFLSMTRYVVLPTYFSSFCLRLLCFLRSRMRASPRSCNDQVLMCPSHDCPPCLPDWLFPRHTCRSSTSVSLAIINLPSRACSGLYL